MSDYNEQAGTFLRVEVDDGGYYSIAVHEEAIVLRAFRDYRERGIDSVVEVEDRHGQPAHLAAATIVGVRRSTPERRALDMLEAIHAEEWERRFRKEHAEPEWAEE